MLCLFLVQKNHFGLVTGVVHQSRKKIPQILTSPLNVKATDSSSRNPPAISRSPQIKMSLWPKTPVGLERCIGAEGVRTVRRE